jgi:hypothetical protein
MKKTDAEYVKILADLFAKHLNWNDQQVIDVFQAEHNELKEDDVLRIYNEWVKKRNTPKN